MDVVQFRKSLERIFPIKFETKHLSALSYRTNIVFLYLNNRVSDKWRSKVGASSKVHLDCEQCYLQENATQSHFISDAHQNLWMAAIKRDTSGEN